ncbi:MAG: metallophosphoesterase [Eubacterium sp.]|nr:metallophosphoesterase [Eubacterium sp.]
MIYFISCLDMTAFGEECMIEIILALLGAAAIVCLLISAWDCNRFVTVEYEIVSDKVTKPCKFALLSDLHNKSFGKDHERLVQEIDRISPDAVLTAGDMLTASRNSAYQKASSLMRQLASCYPVYYGMGNHEYALKTEPEQYGTIYDDYASELAKAGIRPLINENTYLPEYNIAVCGAQIAKCYYQKFRKFPMDGQYLSKMLGDARQDACQILIAHTPQYFEEYAAWGADIVVSGHIHGGIMKLPILGGVLSPNLTLFPKYDGGRFTIGKSTMILSRGLGTHTIPVRVFNPGELVVVNVVPDSQTAERTSYGDSC